MRFLTLSSKVSHNVVKEIPGFAIVWMYLRTYGTAAAAESIQLSLNKDIDQLACRERWNGASQALLYLMLIML